MQIARFSVSAAVISLIPAARKRKEREKREVSSVSKALRRKRNKLTGHRQHSYRSGRGKHPVERSSKVDRSVEGGVEDDRVPEDLRKRKGRSRQQRLFRSFFWYKEVKLTFPAHPTRIQGHRRPLRTLSLVQAKKRATTTKIACPGRGTEGEKKERDENGRDENECERSCSRRLICEIE